MKINDIDWSKVPDILAKEQVRLLCHCSKRTALYYLKSGKLPCIYSGKKTRCYKIRKEDLMAFIEDRENHPEFYAVPEGWYGGSVGMIRRQYSSAVKIDGEDLHEYYRFLLKEYPDVLEVKKVSEITGYGIPVISRWCRTGKVKYFSIRAMNMIPKIYLIDFFCSNAFRTISRKSEWHISSLQNYRRWKYLDSLQSKWGKDELSISGGSSFFALAISPLATQAKLCHKVSSSAFQSINLILWNLFQRDRQPIDISYRYSAPVKGAFLLSQNQVRTRKSAFFKKIEKNFWRGLIFDRFRCLPSEGQNNRPREPWKPNTHSTGTFLIGGEGPSRMKVRHELPAHRGYHGKQGW